MIGKHMGTCPIRFAHICALVVYHGASNEIPLTRSVAMPDDTPLNTLPADALFTLALTGEDEEQSWSAITQLHRVATEAVFTEAARLCRSTNAHERQVGVDVIAQLGLPTNTFHEQDLRSGSRNH